MDNTQKNNGTQRDISWFTPEWLYDEIMRHIEPDLVSSKVSLLDEKYKGESKKEHEDRMISYDTAFAIFDMALDGFQTSLMGDIKKKKQEVRKRAQKKDSEHNAQVLQNLEQDISNTES